MKKYFFIAVAAVAAMAACTKSELDTTSAPEQKIGFEVANYSRQTKANVALTNAEDGLYQFHTYAYQFPKLGDAVEFMNTDIFAWDNADPAASGDNCAKWLLKLGEKEKVVINLRHLMDFGDAPFKIRVINKGKFVKNMRELVEAAGEYV